ncbi:AAA family ATPase [bacterium]|nr:AAA family ATPase [bacterium]
MNDLPLTPQLVSVFENAKNLTEGLQRDKVDLDIFFFCFIEDISLACGTILEKQCSLEALRLASLEIVNKKKPNKNISRSYSSKLSSLIDHCEFLQRDLFDLDYISSESMLLCMLSSGYTPKALSEVFNEEGIDKLISNITLFLKDEEGSDEAGATSSFDDYEMQDLVGGWIGMFDENPILDQFSENLNLKASRNEFDKIVDFDDKISEIATILCRKKKPNAILVGAAGTGKTSLIEGLAAQIVNGEAPELIANKVIYSLSLSSMVAGTQYRGQFEERLEKFVDEVKKYENIILFIDEIHTLVGAGGTTENSLEASNILKPELARGTISCIGATTINEYTNTIKKDTALDRRFERVIIKEPSKFQMKEILPTITSHYEDFHCVRYTDDFVSSVIDFCERYTPNKFYPDKAIDVIDHCGAQAKLLHWEENSSFDDLKDFMGNKAIDISSEDSIMSFMTEKLSDWARGEEASFPEVTVSHLKDFFSKKENPLRKPNILSDLSSSLKEKFVGNNGGIDSLIESISLSRYGMHKKASAPSIYCITGAASTGKSFFCSTLKDSLEKSGVNVLNYSGVHFSDEFAKFKILPETMNNTSLCEKINIQPNSVIIIDDFHKLHVSVRTLFSQILKDGKLQMSNGDIADFSNAKIFVTSGVGNSASMGFKSSGEIPTSSVFKELLSLVDCNILLKEVRKKDIFKILYGKLQKINEDLKLNNMEVVFTLNFLKKFARSSKGLVDFENRFDDQITKFICEEITKNTAKINLNKMSVSS